MENLLKETLDFMRHEGKTPADIIYIGNRAGWGVTWEKFQELADKEYNDSYGGTEVATDLEIHFRDGSWMERGEYDGSEWWESRKPFAMPLEIKEAPTLFPEYPYSLTPEEGS